MVGLEMGERAEKVPWGLREMPLCWWCEQLWGRNTDKRGAGGNPNPGCTEKAVEEWQGRRKTKRP